MKYILGATDVKIIAIGLTIYREALLEVARNFLSGYNVSREVKEAVHSETQMVEELLGKMNPESEYVIEDPDEKTRLLIQTGFRLFGEIFEEFKQRLKLHTQDIDSREMDYVERRLRWLQEFPIFLIER